jgi:hypothetical protein
MRRAVYTIAEHNAAMKPITTRLDEQKTRKLNYTDAHIVLSRTYRSHSNTLH